MDTEGTELRAKMQSTSLLSDMESFKAANPGSILSDFVRWHSPRDWEEDGSGKVFLLNRSFDKTSANLLVNAHYDIHPIFVFLDLGKIKRKNEFTWKSMVGNLG